MSEGALVMGLLSWFRYRDWILLYSIIFIGVFSGNAQQITRQQQEIEYYRGVGILPLTGGINNDNLAPGSYLIPQDIMIEKGKQLTIFAGTTIYFTQNAMLVVNGKLVCSGSADAPIVFRKLDNQKYFEPIDTRVETRWDGIYLPDSAQLEMNHTVVSDSKYGIVISGKDVSMIFNSVLFTNNKFQNVKIGNRELKINENTPIVFRYPEQQGVFEEPALVKYATETIQNDRKRFETAYPQLRISMAIAGIIGLGVGITGITLSNKYYDEFEKTEDKDYEEKASAGRIAAVSGSLLFGVGVIGFTWTLFF